MEDFTCAFETDGRIQTDRQTDSLHRLGEKLKIQMYGPTHEIWSHTQNMHVHDDSDHNSDLWQA